MIRVDYIIIGAGTAGGALAKKLTDNPSTSVLVLEAGTNLTTETINPALLFTYKNFTNNRFLYNIFSPESPVIDRQLAYWSGRLIGGSSQINAMYAVRGSRALYDRWAQRVGPQWSYNRLLPLFKEMETYTGKTQNPFQRGRHGPLYVRQENLPNKGTIANVFTTAIHNVTGAPIVEDYNTGISQCTFTKSQLTQRQVGNLFLRSSTATAYLNRNIVTQSNPFNPIERGIRRQLLIFGKSTVNKVLLRKRKGKIVATGVQFVQNGHSQTAFARKGVIVSAGIWSPIVLQRSGIGGRQDLLRAGIKPIVVNENVGRNMQSQYRIAMGIEVETSRLLQVNNADPVAPYVFGAFLNKRKNTSRKLQLFSLPRAILIPQEEVKLNNWDFNSAKPTNVMSIALVNLDPGRENSAIVAHSDPEAYPEVRFNPLQNQAEVAFVVQSYLEVYRVLQEARKLDPGGIYKAVFPPEKVFQINDPVEKSKQLLQYANASLCSFYHYAGQCRMSRSKATGVVDQNLNVYGVNHLKVVDLSVAPIIPDGNTCIPSIMIGLKAFQIIKSGR
ncbi:GMC family oxidoreductase [Marininema halotolerans]|uniref:Choline dehydrogenase n=1 Tax=Marininema halotolerans TaxID=1155944 RepID=A0A1I6PP98_9BACL|nr:GMC family oxidoreductase [Marininema halotolerans]SFS42042.1 choline dehydrogenase [Marininema halotolerans]